jgi:L-ascorbate metabolism protein UlaG (beta-lactamase superfamily)
MQITKIGHCCLLIKDQGLAILTDPGAFSSEQDSMTGIDVVLITHEHQDHFHVDSVKAIMKNNLNAKIVTNTAVGKFLDEAQIPYQILEHGDNENFGEVLVEGFGEKHAEVYKAIPLVQNTGYFISGRLFYPGDAFTDPGKPVEILALPVAGPWLKISEPIDYAKALKPKFSFPVHDAIVSKAGGFIHNMMENFLKPDGIKYILPDGQTPMEF